MINQKYLFAPYVDIECIESYLMLFQTSLLLNGKDELKILKTYLTFGFIQLNLPIILQTKNPTNVGLEDYIL